MGLDTLDADKDADPDRDAAMFENVKGHGGDTTVIVVGSAHIYDKGVDGVRLGSLLFAEKDRGEKKYEIETHNFYAPDSRAYEEVRADIAEFNKNHDIPEPESSPVASEAKKARKEAPRNVDPRNPQGKLAIIMSNPEQGGPSISIEGVSMSTSSGAAGEIQSTQHKSSEKAASEEESVGL